MIPPDALCDYIYYTNVVVVKGNLFAIEVTRSWNVFTDTLATFKKTSGGIAFDVRYVTVVDLDATLDKSLKDLALKNVRHYGVLNVIEISSRVKAVFAKAKDLLKRMKDLQESDPTRKTVIAMGLLNYDETHAWPTLRSMFAEAVNKSVADTVIAYSSVGWIQNDNDCVAHPPSLWDYALLKGKDRLRARRAPDIKTVVEMMRKDWSYKEGSKMGFSFELATVAYKLKTRATFFDETVNAPCNELFLTHQSVLTCRDKATSVVIQHSYHFDSGRIYMVDDVKCLEVKCKKLASDETNLRRNLSVLLLNVHLGDFTKNGWCSKKKYEDRRDPFYRIKEIRTDVDACSFLVASPPGKHIFPDTLFARTDYTPSR
ncbi:hypothetical protein MTO96_024403 [Rhipicephalus appendiculatus]